MPLYFGLVDMVQPTNVLLPMLECLHSARIQSDFLYPLSLSQHMLHLYATKIYFTYICKLRCILPIGHDDHAHIHEYFCVHSSLVHHNQSSAVGAWHKPILFSDILDWFDLVHHKFDHRSSLRKLNLILNNKNIYLFVFTMIMILCTSLIPAI
jgi:hypothetical protein